MNHNYVLLKTKIKTFLTPVKNSEWMKLKTDSRKVYVFLGGLYQNLGDMAISYAQKKFLQREYPEAEIVIISSTETYQAVKAIKRFIKPEDVITVNGGGNTGNLYQSLEDARLHVVRSFPKNRVILFPQTVEFSDSPEGRASLKRSRQIYEKHGNLVMAAREKESYDRIEKYFPSLKRICCPDIVLSLNKIEPKAERSKVVCCLRNDSEGNISSDFKSTLIEKVKQAFPNVHFTDTVNVAREDCTIDRYEQTLERFWKILRESKVVLTDRLHCMIFCVITGTPCVVLDNANHKISGVFKSWLNGITYVSLIGQDDNAKIIGEMKRLSQMAGSKLCFPLSEQFETLYDAVKDNKGEIY